MIVGYSRDLPGIGRLAHQASSWGSASRPEEAHAGGRPSIIFCCTGIETGRDDCAQATHERRQGPPAGADAHQTRRYASLRRHHLDTRYRAAISQPTNRSAHNNGAAAVARQGLLRMPPAWFTTSWPPISIAKTVSAFRSISTITITSAQDFRLVKQLPRLRRAGPSAPRRGGGAPIHRPSGTAVAGDPDLKSAVLAQKARRAAQRLGGGCVDNSRSQPCSRNERHPGRPHREAPGYAR